MTSGLSSKRSGRVAQSRGRVAVFAAAMDSGGAERVALHLASSLAARGFLVDLVLVRCRGELLEDVPANVAIVDLQSSRALSAIMPFRRYLKRSEPDAVIAINFEVNVAAAAAVLSLRRRPKVVLTVHSNPSRYFGDPSLAGAFRKGVSKVLYRIADAVVAVSDGVRDDLAKLRWSRPGRTSTIYNPVIPHNFETLASAPVSHPWLSDRAGAARAIPVICAVGRLTAAKDYKLLLVAFSKLISRRPARLVIVGEGECRAEIEAQIATLGLGEHVSLLGYMANPYPVMRLSDLFVLSSTYEGFGNVLVEALAAGARIVSTDCPHGPREILEGGKWGRLVPTADPDALARAMEEALDSPRADVSSRAMDFTVDAAVDDYVALLEKLGRGHGRA